MPTAALSQLESLLTARKLDHTLTSRLPGYDHGLAPTGLAPLDDWLGGGLPRGQISEIVGPRSTGRQTVMVSSIAAATARGELAALVDPLDMFDPPSAAAQGVELARLLWIRGCALGADRVSLPREVGDLRPQLERAVKALNLILQAGGFGLVVLDLAELPLPVVGRLPFTTWRRLARVVEGSETACLVVASEPLARSAGGITLALNAAGSGQRAAGRERADGGGQPAAGSRQTAGRVPVPAASAYARMFPRLAIEGHAIHARGRRSNHIVLGTQCLVLGP